MSLRSIKEQKAQLVEDLQDSVKGLYTYRNKNERVYARHLEAASLAVRGLNELEEGEGTLLLMSFLMDMSAEVVVRRLREVRDAI